ncbi:Chorismate_bind domain-containing protein/Anth_synt_I_N domain-containing protein [Cephalotus follicularis]|uniref:Chorismate_bind domain-containing protein/Anth_synt_I_N domain-containing protein n=1 Tax=Cephalotus follicularis TaxID=3775 RepID=A0A1Q3B860_CEPFO|nr:Chorismate_bind domain-containing protein/Anth_synt_I_N domain-containing protein [Cephalotus follicularis]
MDHEEGRKTEEIVEDPMTVPRRIMEGWNPQRIDELPEAFCGGWVGYFSYDTVRFVEKKKLPFSSAPLDDRNLPDVHLGLYGDIFQIVLSQRFERRTFADPFEIYRALRIVNPSPDCILVASSPEILTRVKKQRIVNRPLAGTVRRGKTPKEDLMLEKELLIDEKQCAEHIMLVDLGRNDVGKVLSISNLFLSFGFWIAKSQI